VRDEKPEGIDCRQTVPRCQGQDQLAIARRTKVRHNDRAAVRLACNRFQAAFDFQPFRMSTKVASAPSATDCRSRTRIENKRDMREVGRHLFQNPAHFPPIGNSKSVIPVKVATRPDQTCHGLKLYSALQSF